MKKAKYSFVSKDYWVDLYRWVLKSQGLFYTTLSYLLCCVFMKYFIFGVKQNLIFISVISIAAYIGLVFQLDYYGYDEFVVKERLEKGYRL